MERPPHSPHSTFPAILLLALAAAIACSEGAPTASPTASGEREPSFAAGGSDPTVKATDPDSATVDTTLDVRVLGSGYDQGSRAQWAYQGVVDETKIRTNSTRFVSSTELVANITIARNANLGLWDVVVTTSTGKPGIGTEMFEVTVKITDLGTLGGTESSARDVNNVGQVVGWSTIPSGDRHAFLWTESGGMRDLGTLGGTRSEALAINDAGQVVGFSYTASGLSRAFLWTEAEGMRELATAEGVWCQAVAISENGLIVGNYSGGSAFVWSAGIVETIRDAAFTGVNDLGQVVGSGGGSAALWTKTATGWVAEDLGVPDYSYGRWAYGINNNGEVTGWYRSADNGDGIAFSWTRAGGLKTLPALPRANSRGAYAINNGGRIAGWAYGGKTSIYPTVWDRTPDGWIARNIGDNPGNRGEGYVYGVNENHQAVGHLPRLGGKHAILWDVP